MGAAAVLGKQHFRAAVACIQLHNLNQGVAHATGCANVLQERGIRQQADGCVVVCGGGRPEPEHRLLLLAAVPVRLHTKRKVGPDARRRETAAGWIVLRTGPQQHRLEISQRLGPLGET